jgi:hypothetical protein
MAPLADRELSPQVVVLKGVLVFQFETLHKQARPR